MKRLLLGAIGILIVAGAGWMGSRVAADWSRLRETDAGIREQEGVVQTAREESKKLSEEIERAKNELGEAPDSLGAGRAGLLLKKSFNIAKAEGIVEQDRLRAQRRARYLKEQREDLVKNLKRWGVALVLVEAFLIGGMIVVGRYAYRRCRE